MDYLKEAGYHTLTLDDLLRARRWETALPYPAVIVTFDDGFASNYELGFPVLRRNDQRATIFMTPDRSSGNFKAFAHLDRPLEDRALLEMSRHGIDIQSHGLTHRFLTELDDHELRREIEEPRRIIESVTGKSVRFMAIPGGDYDGRVRRAARESGY